MPNSPKPSAPNPSARRRRSRGRGTQRRCREAGRDRRRAAGAGGRRCRHRGHQGHPDAKADAKPAQDDGAHYLLQAGAFQASGDAEAVKAKIALLGLTARVESAQIADKTVFRVRMGPYGSASELADAKRRLGSGGLPAMAIKAR